MRKNLLQSTNAIIENMGKLNKNLDPHEKWESIKRNVIEHAKKYSIKRAQDKRFLINKLTELTAKLEGELDDKATIENIALVERTKADLNDLIIEKTKGAIFRSKAQWFNESEKPTKYFLNLEKTRSAAKGIVALKKENGQEIHNDKQIMKEIYDFYSKLYTSNPTINFTETNQNSCQTR